MVLKSKEYDNNQDDKMKKISEDTKHKELKDEINRLKAKIKLVESSRD
jgi:hypothetical protein